MSNPQYSFYGPHGEGFGERGRERADLKGTRGSYVAGPAGGIHAIDTVHTGDPDEGIFYGYGIRKPNTNPGPGHHHPHPGTPVHMLPSSPVPLCVVPEVATSDR